MFINIIYKTPLLYAIDSSKDKLVDLLLRYGADPNFVDGCRFTPLEAAKSKRDMLNAMLKKFEDDGRVHARLLREGIVANNAAIIQMLEDANRVG